MIQSSIHPFHLFAFFRSIPMKFGVRKGPFIPRTRLAFKSIHVQKSFKRGHLVVSKVMGQNFGFKGRGGQNLELTPVVGKAANVRLALDGGLAQETVQLLGKSLVSVASFVSFDGHRCGLVGRVRSGYCCGASRHARGNRG